MMLGIILFALLSQTDLPDEKISGEPLTNSGESFKDPFAEPSDSLTTPPDAPPTTEAAPTTPHNIDSPLKEPQSAPLKVPTNQEPQFEEVAPSPAPKTQPLPAPSTLPMAPKSNFNFPDLEEFKGPISQEVAQANRTYAGTVMGTWNLGFNAGMGLNVNKRHQQVQLEGVGGYRWFENFELGGIFSYRFVDDKLLGMIVTGKNFWRITSPPTIRIDLGLGGGLGWTLRAVRSSFTEGRLTVRAQAEALFYIYPDFVLTSMWGFETFPFSLTSDGDGQNLMKSGGPPTQMLVTVGTRWEF